MAIPIYTVLLYCVIPENLYYSVHPYRLFNVLLPRTISAYVNAR